MNLLKQVSSAEVDGVPLKQKLRMRKPSPDGLIRLAIPNKGELSSATASLLNQEKIADVSAMDRKYFARFDDVLIIRANASDIPNLVDENIVDFGISGYDRILESSTNPSILCALGYGKCRVSLSALDTPEPASHFFEGFLDGKVVATSLPTIASSYLLSRKINAKVRYLKGALEGSVLAGVSSAIIDVVSSGRTLSANGLIEVATIMESEAVLFQKRRE